jgi:erythromycin esterase
VPHFARFPRIAAATLLIVLHAACAGQAVPPPAVPPVAAPSSTAAVAPPGDPTRAVVEGIVRGPGGAPVDGALVAVVSAADDGPPREAASVVAEGGGRFRFADLPPGKYAVTATAPGLTAAYVDAFAVEAGKTTAGVEAKLGGEGRRVRGVVVGPQRQPVAGALVRLLRVSQVAGDIFLARTDAHGLYEVRLPAAPYGLEVEAPGLESPSLALQGATGDETLDVSLTRAFPPSEPPPAEVTAWLKQAAVPLSTVEPDHGFADLARVGEMVGAARVVALGEATHGTRDFFQLKHRVFEYLVAERGFTAFAFEASFAESVAVDAYVRTGKGDPAELVARLPGWIFDTEEVLALVRWMRLYNEDPKHPRKLRFHGFDMQYPSGSAQALVAYLHRVDPAFEPEARRALALVDDDFTVSVYEHLPTAVKDASGAAVAALGKHMDEHREAYVKRAGAEAFALARLHAAVVSQAERMLAVPVEAGISLRDRAMAENVRALLDLEGPAGKMALWAENGHVGRELTAFAGGVYQPMGYHLTQALGAALVTFGFAAGGGSFQALEVPMDTGRGVIDFTVPRAPPGSLDGALASLGLPVLALDMRRAPREGIVADWLGARLPTRDTGCCFSDAMVSEMRVPFTPRGSYDALLFVEKTSAARPNPGARWSALPVIPTEPALRNGGMEDGPPGEPPAGWVQQGDRPKARAPYQVLAITDHPREGKRCAVIARETSPWPRGDASLTQTIDAAPLRGKRVRLRAALRAEVNGVGNEAHLFAQVDGPGRRTLAVMSTFDRPIVDRAWRVYDVEVDVPQEAASLTVGAALSGNGKAFVDEVSLAVVGH